MGYDQLIAAMLDAFADSDPRIPWVKDLSQPQKTVIFKKCLSLAFSTGSDASKVCADLKMMYGLDVDPQDIKSLKSRMVTYFLS